MSFTTKSEILKEELLKLLKNKYGIVKKINRNQRDGVYNIMIKNEDAQNFAHYLYDDCELAMPRKLEKAKEIFNWIRTKPKATSKRKAWSQEEDQYILNHSIEDSMKTLGRTESSIKNRLFRIKKSIKEQ